MNEYKKTKRFPLQHRFPNPEQCPVRRFGSDDFLITRSSRNMSLILPAYLGRTRTDQDGLFLHTQTRHRLHFFPDPTGSSLMHAN